MAKKTVTLEVFECDHIDEKGVSCTGEGSRQAIKECAICKKDLCSRHYEMFALSNTSGRASLTYFFCPDHAEEFVNKLIETLGDTRPVPYAGMAK